MLEIADKVTWTPNIWQGVSVENQFWAKRIVKVPAHIKFLSVEPLIDLVDLTPWLSCLQWVIVGGESGDKFRKMDINWARSIRDQCKQAGVPFFDKQGNGPLPGMYPQLDGVEHHQWPEDQRSG